MGWTGNSKKTSSPSIVKITTHFNQLAHFTSQKILEAEKIQTRLQVLSYFIHVANYCLHYDNYDGVKSIVSGLQSTPVHRLNRSWSVFMTL
jgi:RasGEF domain